MKNARTTEDRKVQRRVTEIAEFQKRFGGYKPEYVSMYYAVRLDTLTRVLKWLTIVLAMLAGIQIALMAMSC